MSALPDAMLEAWGEYMAHIEATNRAINRHNGKLWRDCRRQNSKMRREYAEINREVSKGAFGPWDDYKRAERKYQHLPWYKKLITIAPAAPFLMHPRSMPRLSAPSMMPITVRTLQPSVEQFLTWELRRRTL